MTTYGDIKLAAQRAAEGMKSKLCGWPLCECKADHDRLYHEAVAMADESQPPPTQAQLDALYVASTVNLAAISKCCADRRDRYLATIMMMQPTFRETAFDAALARLCAADEEAEAADPEPEPPPAEPNVSTETYLHIGPEPDPALYDYGPMFLGTAGKETLVQRKARHDAINRKRRLTLHEVPAAEPPEELEPMAVKGGSN
jgi:hypothetical protein